MFYRVRDCPFCVISLYNSKKTGIFKDPNRDLIRAELSALRPGDLPTAIKGHREWNKINDFYFGQIDEKQRQDDFADINAT
ncbi:hypothetical protein Glove_62g21 [Diversispora epigaea]|uniref:Uncharacterized protein n=1 Tax=Diversispora epigaea TaxID=1348612 RepID=A0A397JMH2_9GLOM|nr:hypothetical protein Glove_62g21 [Diversispora epigaea]